MKGIFISYRRDDTSGYSRLLYDRLVREFGEAQVFMDVETIREPGTDFVDAINHGVGQCSVLLALIGRSWVSGTDRDGKRRLDDPDDFVRLEVATALSRDVRVIPIVVQGARMPGTDDLPDNLKSLARRQALTLSHEDWEHDVGKLTAALARIPGLERKAPDEPQVERRTAPPPAGRSSTAKTAAIAVLGTLVVAFGALMWIGFAMESEQQKQQANAPATMQFAGNVADTPADVAVPAAEPAPPPVAAAEPPVARSTPTVDVEVPASTRVSPPVATLSEPAPSHDLSGTWYDNNGIPVLLEQYGESLKVGAFDALSMQFYQIGSGTISGNNVTIRYTNAALGISGTVVGTVSSDGQHLNGTDTMDGTGYSEQNTWHLEHMPGH